MREEKMGMFKVKARITNPDDPRRYFEEDFWVDTGSMYTFIPEDRLDTIGIKRQQSRNVTLADGSRGQRFLGSALITLPDLNESMQLPVMFGSKESLYLLGAMALEGFSVEPDPITKKLKPVAAIIAAHFDGR